MKWYYTIFILISSEVVKCNYTFSYHMAMQCKEYLCTHGYNYKTYFRVNSEERRKEKSDPSVIFELHIAILAASNGHILLSSVPQPDSYESVYEIVIGGGGNRFTELRRNLRRNAKASIKTLEVLSPIEFRAFYIKITEDGLIEFGKEGEILPIISYMDLDAITVKYFSFAAWSGVEAKFLYDCPVSNETNSTDNRPNSQPIDPKMSTIEKLKQTLLSGKDPLLSPAPTMTVSLRVKVISLNYDAFESKLSTGLAIIMKWTDNSMAWNPTKYNETTTLKFRQGQIWTPAFHVFNSDSSDPIEARNPELVSMVHSGEATFHLQTVVHTWCFDYNDTYTKWPRDEYKCAIVIQPWDAHEKISLTNIKGDEEIVGFADIDEVIQNVWELSSRQYIIESDIWNGIYPSISNKTHQSDRYIINIDLKRNATAYNLVFYTPLLVLMTFVLLSFFSEPVCLSRVWFYLSCCIIICIGLCYIDHLVPCHTTPTILILYTVLLSGVLWALLTHVVLMTSPGKRISDNILIQNLLMAPQVRYVFGLPTLRACKNYENINEGYSRRDDDEAESDLCSSRNDELSEEKPETQSSSKDLAVLLDKAMFATYSITFAVMLALHF